MGRNRKIRAPEEEAFRRGLRMGLEQGLRTEDRDGNVIWVRIGRVRDYGYIVRDVDGLVFAPLKPEHAISLYIDMVEKLGFRIKASK